MKKNVISLALAGLMVLSAATQFSVSTAFAKEKHKNNKGVGIQTPHQFSVSSSTRENEHGENGNGLKIGHIIGIGNPHKEENESTSTPENQESNGSLQNPTAIQNLINRLQNIIAQLEARLSQILGQQNAPVISTVTATNVSSTSATVNWTTDASSTSKVYYSTSSPVNLGTASTTTNTILVTNHSLNLAGLTPSSTYFFVAQSANASNISSTSSQQSFLTLSL